MLTSLDRCQFTSSSFFNVVRQYAMFSKGLFAIQLCWILSFILPLAAGIELLDFGLPLGFRPAENTQQFDETAVNSRTFANSRPQTRESTRAFSSSRTQSINRESQTTRNTVTSQSRQASSTIAIIRTTTAASSTAAMGTMPSSVAAPTSTAPIAPIAATSRVMTTPTAAIMSSSVVIPSPTAVPEELTSQQASGQSAFAQSPTATPIGLPDAVPFPSSDKGGLSPMGQLGLSFGITFGILGLAAGIAILIWYRRRHPPVKDISEGPKGPGGGGMSNPFASIMGRFKRKKDPDANDDQEWSIESAERVSIVKNMQAQSVSTVTRSSSKSSTRPGEEEQPKAMKEGRTNGLALNPITPKSAVFPMPPSSGDVEKMQEKPVAQKPNEWPLSR